MKQQKNHVFFLWQYENGPNYFSRSGFKHFSYYIKMILHIFNIYSWSILQVLWMISQCCCLHTATSQKLVWPPLSVIVSGAWRITDAEVTTYLDERTNRFNFHFKLARNLNQVTLFMWHIFKFLSFEYCPLDTKKWNVEKQLVYFHLNMVIEYDP